MPTLHGSPQAPSPPPTCAEAKLRPVMHELAYNLESFNPAFTAVLLKVQQTIGYTDYVRRDTALKHLIQPLAGEYGMHNNEPQGEAPCLPAAGRGGQTSGGSRATSASHGGRIRASSPRPGGSGVAVWHAPLAEAAGNAAKRSREPGPCSWLGPPAARTHRELFSIFYADLMKEPLEALLAAAPRPPAAELFFAQMMRDINGAAADAVEQVRGTRPAGATRPLLPCDTRQHLAPGSAWQDRTAAASCAPPRRRAPHVMGSGPCTVTTTRYDPPQRPSTHSHTGTPPRPRPAGLLRHGIQPGH